MKNALLRTDPVYELSFFFSVVSRSSAHMQATANSLSKLYQQINKTNGSKSINTSAQGQTFAIVRLIQSFTETTPFGGRFYDCMNEITAICGLLPAVDLWVRSLSTNILRCNYAQTMHLTDNVQLDTIARSLEYNPGDTKHLFARHALSFTLSELREALRLQTWKIIRAAYRQITHPYDDWCRLSLGLENECDVERWLKEHENLDEVVAKPGSTSIWLLRKTRGY
jgi:hypothetical protein